MNSHSSSSNQTNSTMKNNDNQNNHNSNANISSNPIIDVSISSNIEGEKNILPHNSSSTDNEHIHGTTENEQNSLQEDQNNTNNDNDSDDSDDSNDSFSLGFDAIIQYQRRTQSKPLPEHLTSILLSEPGITDTILHYVSAPSLPMISQCCKLFYSLGQNIIRQRTIQLLNSNGIHNSISTRIEYYLYQNCGKSAGPGAYNNRLRIFLANMRSNPYLIHQLEIGLLTPQQFVRLDRQQLTSPQLLEENERIRAKALEEARVREAPADLNNMYRCSSCGSVRQWIRRHSRHGLVDKFSEVLVCCDCRSTVSRDQAIFNRNINEDNQEIGLSNITTISGDTSSSSSSSSTTTTTTTIPFINTATITNTYSSSSSSNTLSPTISLSSLFTNKKRLFEDNTKSLEDQQHIPNKIVKKDRNDTNCDNNINN